MSRGACLSWNRLFRVGCLGACYRPSGLQQLKFPLCRRCGNLYLLSLTTVKSVRSEERTPATGAKNAQTHLCQRAFLHSLEKWKSVATCPVDRPKNLKGCRAGKIIMINVANTCGVTLMILGGMNHRLHLLCLPSLAVCFQVM